MGENSVSFLRRKTKRKEICTKMKVFSQRISTRIITFILSLLILFFAIPSVVFAEAANAINSLENTDVSESDSVDVYSYVGDAFEVEELREENTKHFTVSELKELEYDINGYLIPENILDKYKGYIGQKLGNSRTIIKDIGTVKHETTRFPAILGRVDGIRMSKSRTGREWVYIALSDGLNDITVMMSKTKYLSRKKTFEVGNILALPVSFSLNDDGSPGDRETCFLSDEKIEIKRVG